MLRLARGEDGHLTCPHIESIEQSMENHLPSNTIRGQGGKDALFSYLNYHSST